MFWKGPQKETPPPYIVISKEDVLCGKWSAADENLKHYVENYIKQLDTTGKFQHTIWPEHCVISTRGHCIVDPVLEGEFTQIFQPLYHFSEISIGEIKNVCEI